MTDHKNRKYPRMKAYDYSLPGYYYVTIHNERDAPFLSRIGPGDGRRRAGVILTKAGKTAMTQLLAMEARFAHVKVDKYVIMPTHIHMILRLLDGVLPRPGLTDIIGAYKSFTTRELNAIRGTPGKRQFQRSFYEAVIRNEAAYQSCWRYIDGNPDRWGLREELEWDYRVSNESKAEETDLPNR